jgi:ribonuclease HI
MKLIVHTDGGSRGNPGKAAVGVVIEDDKKNIIVEFGKTIGETTNNVAEYTGIIEALNKIQELELKIKGIEFYLDSTLVVNQLNGLFKVKDHKMRELLLIVRQLEQGVGGSIMYFSVPREQNARADSLVNQALDNR